MTLDRRIAVIGAGVAGLACARTLHDAGATVTIFEREPHPGGRAATLIDAHGPYDHGAQYFTASDERFRDVVGQWQAARIVQRWPARILAFDMGSVQDKSASVERLVAVPGMRRLGLHLAQGLDVRCGVPASRIERGPTGWTVSGEGPQGTSPGSFDTVLLAVPSPLAVALLDGLTPLVEQARLVQWIECWAVTMALAQRSGADFDGAFVNDDPILGWVALDSAKPRRGQMPGVAERWVLHARPHWSHRFSDMAEEDVLRWVVRSFSARMRTNFNPLEARAVKWPLAAPTNPLPQLCLWDDERRLGMAGDWCGRPRIQGAYLSGLALAEAALG